MYLESPLKAFICPPLAVKSAVFAFILSVLAGCGGSGKTTVPVPENPVVTPTPAPEPTPTPVPTPEITVEHLHSLADMPIGVAVEAGGAINSILTSAPRQAIVEAHFDTVTPENIMKPFLLHPQQDTYDFGDADDLMDYTVAQGLAVHGHVLIWHAQQPDWINSFAGTQTEWQAMMDDHIVTIVEHFAQNYDNVVSWDVVNEAFLDGGGSQLRDSVWRLGVGDDFIARAFTSARSAAGANVDLYYNDYGMENNGSKLNSILAMVDDLQASAVPIDGIGFQMHVNMDYPDVGTFKQALAKVVSRGLKVKLTEMDIARSTLDTDRISQLTPEMQLALADRYKALVNAYLEAVPAASRGGITVWGITDADSWLNRNTSRLEFGVLFNSDFTPKPALQGFADALIETP